MNNYKMCIRDRDTMKRKQFMKGMQQIAQEGAIQIFQEYNMGMEEVNVGVVRVLQFDVLKYRLENEYNVEIRMDNLPYEHIRWIENEDINMDKIVGTSDMKMCIRDRYYAGGEFLCINREKVRGALNTVTAGHL